MAPAAPVKPSLGTKQTIQARHGVATYVPQGYTIKIINTYGKQVVDTWTFALHAPPEDSDIDKGDSKTEKKEAENNVAAVEQKVHEAVESGGDASKASKPDDQQNEQQKQSDEQPDEEQSTPGELAGEESKKGEDDTSNKVEDQAEELEDTAKETAERGEGQAKEVTEEATEKTEQTGEKAAKEVQDTTEKANGTATAATEKAGEKTEEPATTKKNRWSAYIPSLPQRNKSTTQKKGTRKAQPAGKEKSDDDKMSKSWSSYLMRSGNKDAPSNTNSQKKSWSEYIPSGQAFSSYMPTKDTISTFAGSHNRDPTKSYAEQLFDFSKTPVGAAGLSAATGSGYAGSLYAAYKAYEQVAGDARQPVMEYMSMMHTRAATLHMSPRVGDTLVSNIRAPLLTVVEDTSEGVHDTLIAACDPQRYKELGVEKWEEHGSCAENCVLALKEINDKSGLRGKRAIGADVTVNTVPAPLNLFMNIPWTKEGDVSFEAPKTKRGDYIKLKAERDVVVVMSACPQDVLAINGHKPMVAHFVVESSSTEDVEKTKQKEDESKTVLAKARQRMSGQKTPQVRKKSEPVTEAKPVEQAEAKPAEEAKKPSSNAPKAGRKAPRKLEKRSASSQAVSAAKS